MIRPDLSATSWFASLWLIVWFTGCRAQPSPTAPVEHAPSASQRDGHEPVAPVPELGERQRLEGLLLLHASAAPPGDGAPSEMLECSCFNWYHHVLAGRVCLPDHDLCETYRELRFPPGYRLSIPCRAARCLAPE